MIELYIYIILLTIDLIVSSKKLKRWVTCLSECYYAIGMWHCLILLVAVVIILPTMLDATPDQYRCLAFFACGGLLFVAVAPNYLGDEHDVHSCGAMLSGLSAILWTILCAPYALFGGAVVLIGVVDKTRWLLWVEISCFLMIYLGLIL